jgi:hypothetical protein
VEYFPVIDSLSDVLRLRNDRRIVDFRENLRHWADALLRSDSSEEEKIRREIRKSNKALHSLTRWKKAGTLITYLALPLSIVPHLGLPLTIMGAAFQLYVDAVEWRNRWLMIGR